jgi:NAD(P)-dependent dehydrogenase (short-subunit alcohol dehydrogenase family)
MTLAIDLSGKTILVCGVHRGGIGGAVARQIASAGGTVIALDKDQTIIDANIAEVKKLGGAIHSLVADLTDVAQCEMVIPSVLEKFGAIDGVVNVVGGTRGEEWLPLDETSAESFWQTMQFNFAYVFYICRDAGKEWIAKGQTGAIVNVGSVSALAAAPWHGPYGAAKSAVSALTRTMANEWHEFGIRANTVSPGAVLSDRVKEKAKLIPDNARPTDASDLILSEPVQLANVITFLLSDLASGVSGQTLVVDRSLSTKFCAGRPITRKKKA